MGLTMCYFEFEDYSCYAKMSLAWGGGRVSVESREAERAVCVRGGMAWMAGAERRPVGGFSALGSGANIKSIVGEAGTVDRRWDYSQLLT